MGKSEHSYIIRLEAQGGKVVAAELQRVGAEGEKSLSRIDKASARVDSRMNLLTRTMLTRLIPAFSVYQLGRSLATNIQEFEKLEKRLQFLTEGSEEYAKAQEFLRRKSKELHTDILVLSDGYAKLLALQKGGVINNDQLESLITGLTNAKAALGASDTQLGQVIYGLSQALTQGRVQAQEFNQVIEPLPGLMQAMDKAAGVAAGGFREMVKEGKVTSDVFAGTLIKALDEYEGAASSMGDTVTGALTDLHNAWKSLAQAIGESEATDQFIAFNQVLAENLEIMIKAADGTMAFSETFGILEESAFFAARGIKAAMLALQVTILTVAATTLKAVDMMAENIRDALNYIPGVNITYTTAGLDDLIEATRMGAKASAQELGDVMDFEKIKRDRPQKPSFPSSSLDAGQRELARSVQASSLSDKEAKSIQKVIDALRFRNEQMRRSEEEQEIYNQLQAAGVDLNSKQGQEIANLVKQNRALADAINKTREETERLEQAADNIGEAFSSAFEKAAIEGGDFGDILKSILQDIQRELFRTFIGDDISKSVSGLVGSLLPSLDSIIPWRDSGGYVSAGQPYKVGVPEIFIPSNSGKAIPLDMLPNNSSGYGQVNIYNYGSPDRVQIKETKRGGVASLDIIIDQVVAQKINSSGTQTNKALRQFGSTPSTGR